MLEKFFDRILSPFEQFLKQTTSGGLVLICTTALTLLIANSKWGRIFNEILFQQIHLTAGSVQIAFSLHLLVNDGLMTLFFLVVGLELKREILVGELSSIRDAMLPIVAALGGMIVPALIYYGINREGIASNGWGIAMATDIAFAVGILVLLAERIPRNIIIFLTALAIADDLGAVLVIALFYSSSISLSALGWVAGIFIVLIVLNLGGVRHPIPYFIGGVLLWSAMLQSGIHATIAGILLAAIIPARSAYTLNEFKQHLERLQKKFTNETANIDLPGCMDTSECILINPCLHTISQSVKNAAGAVQSPLQSMEHTLGPWVTFLVLPVFAFSNAGIDFSEIRFGESMKQTVTLGVIFGLVAGKFLGISVFSWIAVKLGIGRLPDGVNWRHLLGVAWLGGIGFTMSLFISQLAFSDPVLNEQAKLGILIASALSAVIGSLWLYGAGESSKNL